MQRNILAYIQLSLAMVIIGSTVVVGKIIIGDFPIFLALALRFVIASVIMIALLLKSEKRIVKLENRDIAILFVQAFAGNFLYCIFLLYGLTLTSAAEGGIITGMAPAVIGVLSWLLLREHMTILKSSAVALVVLGVIVINVAGVTQRQGSNPLLGNLLVFGSVLGEAAWTMVGKRLSSKGTPLLAACLTSCFGGLLFSPIAIYQATTFNFAAVLPTAWLWILYYGIVGTVGAYTLWYNSITKVPTSTAGVFLGLVPISAIVCSYFVLGEPLLWSHVLGCACVLIAIFLLADMR